jgi:NAD(P)-dependent dehydrogenase (short-subunit alcohol dehydrogenase family)
MKDFSGKVAVVTGGASGIGKGLVQALLHEGAKVVVADIEQPAIDAAIKELHTEGEVVGIQVDVLRYASVEALADQVFDTFGACHLLFNNAGVSVQLGRAWEATPNDWAWCLGVNVLGPAHGVIAFVPRMVASGEEGRVVNTSSGNGGIAPMSTAAIYATSKAAVTCFTESLGAQLILEKTNVRASIFYPSGGLLRTNLNTSDRSRPAELARERPRDAPKGDWDQLKKDMEKAYGRPIVEQDLFQLGQAVLQGIREDKFILGIGVEQMGERLLQRTEVLAKGDLPMPTGLGA